MEKKFSAICSALFFQGFRPPKNSRPNLSAFLSNFTCSNPKFIQADFLLTEEKSKEPNEHVLPFPGFSGFGGDKRRLFSLRRGIIGVGVQAVAGSDAIVAQ